MTALVWTLWDAVSALQWVIGHWWVLLIVVVILGVVWFWGLESQ
jgi:hypothetical protein